MPKYEFYCKNCEETFEELLPLSYYNSKAKCPDCGNKSERIMSTFCGIVKGSEHRPLDCVIGEDSEKKWDILKKRRKKRLSKKD